MKSDWNHYFFVLGGLHSAKMKGSSYSLRVMKNARQYSGKNTLETPSKVSPTAAFKVIAYPFVI